MTSMPEVIYIAGASVSTASIMLGVGYKLFDNLIERRLLKLQDDMMIRINHKFLQKSECGLLQEKAKLEHKSLSDHILELKEYVKEHNQSCNKSR